ARRVAALRGLLRHAVRRRQPGQSGGAHRAGGGPARPDSGRLIMARPVITFLSDFGPAAPAVCRGVMFGIAPDANIIDVNHQVPRYSIRDGAGSLIFALPHMP